MKETWIKVRSEGERKWLSSEYILKVAPTGFPNRPTMKFIYFKEKSK